MALLSVRFSTLMYVHERLRSRHNYQHFGALDSIALALVCVRTYLSLVYYSYYEFRFLTQIWDSFFINVICN